MKTPVQSKPLYYSQGTEAIITEFINRRFSTTLKNDDGKYISKKKNKRITEAKVYHLIHKLWADRIHQGLAESTINRNILAEKIWGDKKYEVSMILRFMQEDGLIEKTRGHVYNKGEDYNVSAGYTLGEKLNTQYWKVREFPADCAVIRNMIKHGEALARFTSGAEEIETTDAPVHMEMVSFKQTNSDDLNLNTVMSIAKYDVDDVFGDDFDFDAVPTANKHGEIIREQQPVEFTDMYTGTWTKDRVFDMCAQFESELTDKSLTPSEIFRHLERRYKQEYNITDLDTRCMVLNWIIDYKEEIIELNFFKRAS